MRFNKTLWVVQSVLAALFLFAGGMKLVVPLDAMAAAMGLPAWFLRFIGVAEVAGALGLILPGLLRIRPALTPLAACGLGVIMTGAVGLGLQIGPASSAAMPGVIGLLSAAVAYGRTRRPAARPAVPFIRGLAASSRLS